MSGIASFTPEQIEAVADALTSARSMVQYYDAGPKRAQNAALVAAGLAPLHSESLFAWDDEHKAKYERRIAALESLLTLMQPAVTDEAA